MGEQITMLIFGILFIIIGVINIKGDISTIHWYNRTRITEQTRHKYGKLMGSGTVVIGGGLIVSAILNMVIKSNILSIIDSAVILAAVVIGIGLMLYAQIKYNKGIF